MRDCGYTIVPNPDAKDRLWKAGGKRQAIYARQDLDEKQRFVAVRQIGDIA
jgi:hypothetical protein